MKGVGGAVLGELVVGMLVGAVHESIAYPDGTSVGTLVAAVVGASVG